MIDYETLQEAISRIKKSPARALWARLMPEIETIEQALDMRLISNSDLCKELNTSQSPLFRARKKALEKKAEYMRERNEPNEPNKREGETAESETAESENNITERKAQTNERKAQTNEIKNQLEQIFNKQKQ